MTKTYFVCPNFSMSPPPEGLQLGHILSSPFDPEVDPINSAYHIDIPPGKIHPPDIKDGFTSTRAILKGGHLSVWARFLATFGLNAEVGVDIGSNNILSVAHLETQCFEPDMDYVRQSINSVPVAAYMRATHYKAAVFMITGLKIARGAALRTCDVKAVISSVGITVPVNGSGVGMGGDWYNKRGGSTEFEDSTDFVLAFRLRRIRYKEGQLESKLYDKGATMMEGSHMAVGAESRVLEQEDDPTPGDLGLNAGVDVSVLKDESESEELLWIGRERDTKRNN